MREAAVAYAARGWRVFPLHGIVNGRCTCGRGCSSPGKHPLARRGVHDASTDAHQVNEWWRRWRRANIGVATGADSGIVVIDIDLPLALDSIDRLLRQGVVPTLTGLTGGGGVHLVFASEDPGLGNTAGRLPSIDADLPGIDLRGKGGYIVSPPSVHRSGACYEWLDPKTPLAAAPPWLKQPRRARPRIENVASVAFEGDGTPYGLAVLRSELDRLRGVRVGTRNHQLNRSAFALAQLVAGGELLEAPVRASLLRDALAIGLDEPEALQTIDSAFRAGLPQSRVAPHRLSDRIE